MRHFWVLMLAFGISLTVQGQFYEVSGIQPVVSGQISQTLRIPFKLKNTTEKAQLAVFRLADSDFRATQKGYFCIDNDCFESGTTEITRRVEPGATLGSVSFVLESGLVAGQNNLMFDVFFKGVAGTRQEFPVLFNIEEITHKSIVYKSPELTLHDLYPNPVSTMAYMDYELSRDALKAKVVIHNILGSAVGELELPYAETRAKISTEELPPGVYFYTVYLDNEGIITKKLIVRR